MIRLIRERVYKRTQNIKEDELRNLYQKSL